MIGLLGLQTCVAFESFAVTTALPVIAAELDATQWYSLAFAATVTTTLIGMTIGGTWTDGRGIRAPLMFGGSMFLLGLLLCVLAPNMGAFIVGRLLQGIGGGIDAVVIYVIIAQFIPEPLRPRVFGIMTAAWLLPAMIGPLLTGTLVESVHWRVVFALVLVLSAASLTSLLSSTRTAAHFRSDAPIVGARGAWAIVAAVGVFGLHLAGQGLPLQLATGTVVAIALVVLGAMRLLPRGTFRVTAGIPRLVVLRGLLGASVAVTDVYLPLYLQHERGYTPTLAGLVVAIGAIGWVTGAWIQGRSRSTAGDPTILRGSAALVICGPLGVVLFILGLVPIAVTVAGCILMGAGMGLAYPQITSAVLAISPADQQGANSSALQIAESLSTSAFLAITGTTLTLTGTLGYLIDYSLAITISALAVLIALAVRRPAIPSTAV